MMSGKDAQMEARERKKSAATPASKSKKTPKQFFFEKFVQQNFRFKKPTPAALSKWGECRNNLDARALMSIITLSNISCFNGPLNNQVSS